MENQKQISLFQRFVHGELQFGFWGIVTKGIGWGNSFLIISSLSLYEYGVFQLLLSGYAALTDFISWGGLAAGTEILRSIGTGKEARAKRLFYEFNGLRIVSAVALWALFFFGAPALGFRYGDDFILLVRIMSFLFLSEVMLAIVKSILNMRLNFRAIASRSAIGKSFQLTILLGFFVFSSVGLREVLISIVVGHILSTITLIPPAVKAWGPWRIVRAERGSLLLLRIVRGHGKWDSMKNFLSQIVSRFQPWLIKLFVSTEAVGIYGVATAFAGVVENIIPGHTISVLVSKVFHDVKNSRKMFVYSVKYFTLFAAVAAVGASLVVPAVVYMVLPQYVSSLRFFYFLVPFIPVKVLLRMTDVFLIIFRQQKFVFIRMLTRNAAALVLLLILLSAVGLWGVPVTEVFIQISFAYASYRYLLKIRPEFRITPKLFFSFGDEDRKLLSIAWANMKSFARHREA